MRLKIEIEVEVPKSALSDEIPEMINELENRINYQFVDITGFEVSTVEINKIPE
jgi:hypothetical protein